MRDFLSMLLFPKLKSIEERRVEKVSEGSVRRQGGIPSTPEGRSREACVPYQQQEPVPSPCPCFRDAAGSQRDQPHGTPGRLDSEDQDFKPCHEFHIHVCLQCEQAADLRGPS